MSRLPPVPPASKPVHGPEGVAKTSVDISHRVRHQAQAAGMRAGDGPTRAMRAVSRSGSDFTWVLLAAAAALALGYLAGRRAV